MLETLTKMIKYISDINVRIQTIEYVLVEKSLIDANDMREAFNKFSEMRDARVREYEERVNPLTGRLKTGEFAPYPSGSETYIEKKKNDEAHLLKW